MNHYQFLIDSIKTDIRVNKSLIDAYKKDIENARTTGNVYWEGLLNGCLLTAESTMKNLETRLQIVGEEYQ